MTLEKQWSPAVLCDLNEGPQAFASAVKRFREWASAQPRQALKVATAWTTITPELAETLLIRNVRNRTPSYSHVLRYAQAMMNKRWKRTGQPIIITETGDAEDGQHRLLACYFSNTSFQTFVVSDVPADDQLFAYMDNCNARSGEDTLRCAGVNGLSKHAARIVQLYAIRYDENSLVYMGRNMTLSPISNIDVLDYVKAHPTLMETAHLVRDLYPAAIKRIGDAHIATFVAWKIRDAFGSGVLEDFMGDLVRTDLPSSHPIATLQKRLDEHMAALQAGRNSAKSRLRLSPTQILALTMRAFNFSRAGTSVRRLDPRADDPFPRIDADELAEAAQ